MQDLRYPAGTLAFDNDVTPGKRTAWIRQIAELPRALAAAAKDLSAAQIETPYRPGGWTVREVIHHVADSHLNAYTRFKLALTEDNPTIKPYDEAGWATLADTRYVPVNVSLALLEALHTRWVAVLEAMKEEDFARPLGHPVNGPMTLDRLLQLYAWHGRHHTAHVMLVRNA